MQKSNGLVTSHIAWHPHTVTAKARTNIKNHQPCVLWFTGLSGSGKSTIANLVDARLNALKVHSYLLDGDNIRSGLNKDLGFNQEDREENIRRIGEVSKLFVDAGLVVITAFISPFAKDRETARAKHNGTQFLEIFIDTPLVECEKRDPKGLYEKVSKGEVSLFTGKDSLYEAPTAPDIHIMTLGKTPKQCADEIVQVLIERKIIVIERQG